MRWRRLAGVGGVGVGRRRRASPPQQPHARFQSAAVVAIVATIQVSIILQQRMRRPVVGACVPGVRSGSASTTIALYRYHHHRSPPPTTTTTLLSNPCSVLRDLRRMRDGRSALRRACAAARHAAAAAACGGQRHARVRHRHHNYTAAAAYTTNTTSRSRRNSNTTAATLRNLHNTVIHAFGVAYGRALAGACQALSAGTAYAPAAFVSAQLTPQQTTVSNSE